MNLSHCFPPIKYIILHWKSNLENTHTISYHKAGNWLGLGWEYLVHSKTTTYLTNRFSFPTMLNSFKIIVPPFPKMFHTFNMIVPRFLWVINLWLSLLQSHSLSLSLSLVNTANDIIASNNLPPSTYKLLPTHHLSSPRPAIDCIYTL